MEVYIVETTGGQITGYEAIKANVPQFLDGEVSEQFRKRGFCFGKFPELECIIFPTKEAAERAIEWTIKN